MSRSTVEFDQSVPVLMLKIGRYPLHHGTLGAIRSLGRVGVPVYAVTEDAFTPAAVSRYLSGHFTWPTTGDEPIAALRDGLRKVAEGLGRPAIVVPTDDVAAALIAEHNDAASPLVAPKVPPPLPRSLASKRGLFELCRRIGIPTPDAVFPASIEDVTRYADNGRFPVVVKDVEPWTRLQSPAVGRSTVVTTPGELLARAREWREPLAVMLQQYVPLEQAEDWIVHMYCDSESVCEPAFTGVKLRSWPPRGGPTAHARTAVNEPLTELSRWLCAEIGYRGIGDLDWRFDRSDGRYKLLDFNPRLGAQFRLFETHAGIDVVRALHLDLTGRRIPASRQVQGRRFVVENLYLSALLSPGERAALAPDLPRSGPKHLELAWFALDDLVPALVMAARLGGARAVRVTVAICRWLGRFHGPRIPRRRRTA